MAIKLVFASVYSDNSRTYFQAIHHKVEEEKMAVILQELVGNQYGNYYYPHISGIAQSYNYYPVAHMKPEEGFAVAAVGLGSYVVDGWKSYRFSPRYPKIEMYTTKDLLTAHRLSSMLWIPHARCGLCKRWRIGLPCHCLISVKQKSMGRCSIVLLYITWTTTGLNQDLGPHGPRIINFADILQFHYIPLAETIDIMLGTIEDALGSPVEIEFAVDLNKTLNNLPSFYLLQIKPLVGNQLELQFQFPINWTNQKYFFSPTQAWAMGRWTISRTSFLWITKNSIS